MFDVMIYFIFRYWGIGIRIEDDVLIIEKEFEVFMVECLKEIEDIERFMNNIEIVRF